MAGTFLFARAMDVDARNAIIMALIFGGFTAHGWVRNMKAIAKQHPKEAADKTTPP